MRGLSKVFWSLAFKLPQYARWPLITYTPHTCKIYSPDWKTLEGFMPLQNWSHLYSAVSSALQVRLFGLAPWRLRLGYRSADLQSWGRKRALSPHTPVVLPGEQVWDSCQGRSRWERRNRRHEQSRSHRVAVVNSGWACFQPWAFDDQASAWLSRHYSLWVLLLLSGLMVLPSESFSTRFLPMEV